jgi:hypothetical protein
MTLIYADSLRVTDECLAQRAEFFWNSRSIDNEKNPERLSPKKSRLVAGGAIGLAEQNPRSSASSA